LDADWYDSPAAAAMEKIAADQEELKGLLVGESMRARNGGRKKSKNRSARTRNGNAV
jgi:hypothetical protein